MMQYYDVVISWIDQSIDKNNKVITKKITEKYLVQSRSCTDAAEKVKNMFEKQLVGFQIQSVKKQNYIGVLLKKNKENQ